MYTKDPRVPGLVPFVESPAVSRLAYDVSRLLAAPPGLPHFPGYIWL